MVAAMHVLVIDDDVDFLAFTQARLGCRVSIARTPLEAFWLLEREAFDAVLCDLRLDDVDGRELLEEIAASWPATTRLLITGYGEQLETTEVLAHTVMYKPCDLPTLRRAVTLAEAAAAG